MPLFSKRKDLAVQSFVLKLVNNNCPGFSGHLEDPRVDSRVNLVTVVTITPLHDRKLQLPKTLRAVTKDFSNTGLSVVLDRPYPIDEAILGFRFDGERTFIRAQAKHRDPMGGGFHQLGFQLIEVISPGDYPELASLDF